VPGPFAAIEDRLLDAMQNSARGPRQNGLFALWLFLRHCEGALPPDNLSERVLEGRLAGLEQRLGSLSLPAPLRRALPASIRELRGDRGDRVGVALQQLVAPAREASGGAVAEALAQAARAARQLVRERPEARARA